MAKIVLGLAAPHSGMLSNPPEEWHLLASSYAPVYGVLSENGRRMYVADGVNFRDYWFDLAAPGAPSRTIPEEVRLAQRGRIEDGILTTDPVDLRLKIKQQTQDNAVFLRDARIRAEVDGEGRIVGILGAYWDAANFWSMMNDHTIGGTPQGRNAAFNRGFMCAGLYHAIPRVADGHPDPTTGRCTSISTALHFEAKPAFVIRPQLAAAERAGE